MTLTLSLIALLGVSPAQAEPLLTPDGLTLDELSRVDVRGTAASAAMIAHDMRELDPQARAQAAESLRVLSANCPYTRAALTLPFALRAASLEIDPDQLDRLVQRDWGYLQQGLADHVEALESLGVDLTAPAPGDHLYDRDPALTPDLAALAADPIDAASPLIHEIVALAERVDVPTSELIERHSDRVEAATGVGRTCPRGPWSVLPGHPWTLGTQLAGWHDALRRVAPFVEDPQAAARIDAMIALLDAYSDAGFASRTGR